MYDYLLNGVHWLPVDEAAAREVLKRVPEAHYMANANRIFLQRAAGVMARSGIRQFIDVGAGIPTQWNTHDVVHVVDPEARVVYFDNDPVVVADSTEMLRRGGETDVIYLEGDIRNPDAILDEARVRAEIDFNEPVGYLHVAVWHFVSNDSDPWSLIRRYMDAVPVGSHLALSHVTSDGQRPEKVQRFVDEYRKSTAPLNFRTRDEIAIFFEGLEFLAPYNGASPGLSYVDKWGSKAPDNVDQAHTWLPCGVARKN